MRDTLAGIEDGIGVDLLDRSSRDRQVGDLLVPGAKTLGELYWESEAHKRLLGSSPGGRFSEKARVQGDPVGFKSLFNRGVKTLITGSSDTSGGAFVTNDYLGLQVGLGAFQRPLTIRDLVTNGTTTSDTVEYVQVTSVTNNAAPTPESTTTADPGAMTVANGVKPESAMAMQKVTATVKTIAHWLPATKRARILALLCEGVSISTATKLLEDAGRAPPPSMTGRCGLTLATRLLSWRPRRRSRPSAAPTGRARRASKPTRHPHARWYGWPVRMVVAR